MRLNHLTLNQSPSLGQSVNPPIGAMVVSDLSSMANPHPTPDLDTELQGPDLKSPDLKSSDLKSEVRDFWNSDPCGTRYLESPDDFDAHTRSRYALEPYIPDFAQFSASRGLRVLEVGVGMGADYLEWLKAGAVATRIGAMAHFRRVGGGACRLPRARRTVFHG